MCRFAFFVAVAIAFFSDSVFGHPTFFSVSPSVSFIRLDGSFRVDPGLAYGAAVDIAVSRRIGAWLSIQTGRLRSQYDHPSGPAGMDISLLVTSAGGRLELTDPVNAAGLSFLAGAGFLRFSGNARVVPAGALGSITIPARSDTRALVSVSLSFRYRILPAVAMRLEPGVMVVSPLAASQGNIFFTGGIRVAIL